MTWSCAELNGIKAELIFGAGLAIGPQRLPQLASSAPAHALVAPHRAANKPVAAPSTTSKSRGCRVRDSRSAQSQCQNRGLRRALQEGTRNLQCGSGNSVFLAPVLR